jgi:hypothetical protein
MDFKSLIDYASKKILEQEKHKPNGSKEDPRYCFCTKLVYLEAKAYLIEDNLFFNEENGCWYKIIVV